MDRDARDDALEKAANEIMPLFTRCTGCSNWVDETCFNRDRNLCVRCAPNLAAEMERERASVELNQMREAMRSETVFSGDTSARRTVCPTCDKPVGSEKFCANCGTQLGTAHCTQCGAELPTRRPVLRQLRERRPAEPDAHPMTPADTDRPTYAGEARAPGGTAAPATVTLDDATVDPRRRTARPPGRSPTATSR